MILKQSPDDFFVEELANVAPGSTGTFALYRLEKRGWTTPDALQIVGKRWKIQPKRVSYAGLKDRHAHTIQYVTILHGPARKLRQQGIEVSYLGQVPGPFVADQLEANRFRLIVRALSAREVSRAAAALEDLAASGVPNYFDDQRFGSVTPEGNFIAKAIVQGDYERALRLALTGAYAHDRAPQKKEKNLLRRHWGNWGRLRDELSRGHARTLVDFLLHHPGDYRAAVVRVRPELRGLYLAAYQSHLWNRMLARWLEDHLSADNILEVDLRLGAVPMYRRLREEQVAAWSGINLPLISGRDKLEESDPRRPYLEKVLAAERVTEEQLKLKGVRELFFSRGERAILCVPKNLTFSFAPDEGHSGQQKLTLAFELPRGSYATLLVKRLLHGEPGA